RNYKEINRRDPVSVVVKEGLPCLRWSTLPRYHVLRDRRLGDVEAEPQELAVSGQLPGDFLHFALCLFGGAFDPVLVNHGSSPLLLRQRPKEKKTPPRKPSLPKKGTHNGARA